MPHVTFYPPLSQSWPHWYKLHGIPCTGNIYIYTMPCRHSVLTSSSTTLERKKIKQCTMNECMNMKWKASLTGVSGESRRDFFSSSMEAHLFSSDCRTRLCWTCCGWEEEVGGWCTQNMNERITRWMIHTKLNACRNKPSALWNISSSVCCGVLTLDPYLHCCFLSVEVIPAVISPLLG